MFFKQVTFQLILSNYQVLQDFGLAAVYVSQPSLKVYKGILVSFLICLCDEVFFIFTF